MKTLKGYVISYSYRIYQKLTSSVLVPAHSISCQPWGVRGQFQTPQGMRPGRFTNLIQIILNTAWWVILMEFHERLKVNLIGVFFSKFMSITWNKLHVHTISLTTTMRIVFLKSMGETLIEIVTRKRYNCIISFKLAAKISFFNINNCYYQGELRAVKAKQWIQQTN